MADNRNIRWLAGLLEGEGCFTYYFHKTNGCFQVGISLGMTDLDVVQHAAAILGSTVTFVRQDLRSTKKFYRTDCHGPRAIGWMQTLYPLMGIRRRAKIADCVTSWKNNPVKTCMTKYIRRYMPGLLAVNHR
jgi:hypothetical protein